MMDRRVEEPRKAEHLPCYNEKPRSTHLAEPRIFLCILCNSLRNQQIRYIKLRVSLAIAGSVDISSNHVKLTLFVCPQYFLRGRGVRAVIVAGIIAAY